MTSNSTLSGLIATQAIDDEDMLRAPERGWHRLKAPPLGRAFDLRYGDNNKGSRIRND